MTRNRHRLCAADLPHSRSFTRIASYEHMSALGHKQTFAVRKGMSALPPKADIPRGDQHVRFVPKADAEPSIKEIGTGGRHGFDPGKVN